MRSDRKPSWSIAIAVTILSIGQARIEPTIAFPQDIASTTCQHALIVSGHPGDLEHQRLFVESVTVIRNALEKRLGFDPKFIRVQFGTTNQQEPGIGRSAGPATREAIETECQQLANRIGANDELWVIVIGHAHFDGRRAFLNLPGIDLPYDDFAKLFDDINCRQQVFFVTTPLSGFVTKPLSRAGRVVITATDKDTEVNETLFHSSLAKMLEKIGPNDNSDLNGDHRTSLLELYVAIARDVAQRYLDDMLVPTEHAQLDDDGDGRGTEIQIDFLTPEQGGRLANANPRTEWSKGRDGHISMEMGLGISAFAK